jgi:hypothetical protein
LPIVESMRMRCVATGEIRQWTNKIRVDDLPNLTLSSQSIHMPNVFVAVHFMQLFESCVGL